jgi:hypothetical protein
MAKRPCFFSCRAYKMVRETVVTPCFQSWQIRALSFAFAIRQITALILLLSVLRRELHHECGVPSLGKTTLTS